MADAVAPLALRYVRFRSAVCYVTGWTDAVTTGCGYGIITAGICMLSALVWTNLPASLVREAPLRVIKDFFGRSMFSPTDAIA
jgi:hypothetical protein